jgi:hypothetical protein
LSIRNPPAAVLVIAIVCAATTGVKAGGADNPNAKDDSSAYAQRIRAVVEGATVVSTIGPFEIPLDEGLANFLLDHPDLSAWLLRQRNIAPYIIKMRGPRQSWAEDGAGTLGLETLVKREDHSRIYYGTGLHHGKVFPDIHATAVIIMKMEPISRQSCSPHIQSSFIVYVRLRNPVLAALVKTLLPFVRGTVDRTFYKAFLAARELGRQVAVDPKEISGVTQSFTTLSGRDRTTFSDLIAALPKSQPSGCFQ